VGGLKPQKPYAKSAPDATLFPCKHELWYWHQRIHI